MPELLFDKRWKLGKWEVRADKRSKHAHWGRFGGGWQWKFGVMVGGRTTIISLLVFDVRITRPARRKRAS